jgi:hypothetical protein
VCDNPRAAAHKYTINELQNALFKAYADRDELAAINRVLMKGTAGEQLLRVEYGLLQDQRDAAIAMCEKLAGALIREAPKWNACEHDYEPNTTMDYFRCDRCGARPHVVEALAEWDKFKNESP